MKYIAGIDEAGRGPVIGPLVMAGVKIKRDKEKKLIDIGVKDSKLLSPSMRKRLFDKIKKISDDVFVVKINPKEIDETLFGDESNLNLLEAEKIAFIVNKLKPDKVYIDCPSVNIEKYKKTLVGMIKTKTDIVLEHKADVKYAVVSAASIIAKVIRDNEIKEIEKRIGKKIGSGYPSDPITQEFLEKYSERYKDIFRKSWKTYTNIVKKKMQKKLFDF